MMTLMEHNRTFIEQYFRAFSGQPKTAALIERFVSDQALAEHIIAIEAAFPRYELEMQDMIAEGDRVAVRALFRGNHAGPFAGIEPTGATVTAGLIIIYRIEDNRVAEHWLQFDRMELMAQLHAANAK